MSPSSLLTGRAAWGAGKSLTDCESCSEPSVCSQHYSQPKSKQGTVPAARKKIDYPSQKQCRVWFCYWVDSSKGFSHGAANKIFIIGAEMMSWVLSEQGHGWVVTDTAGGNKITQNQSQTVAHRKKLPSDGWCVLCEGRAGDKNKQPPEISFKRAKEVSFTCSWFLTPLCLQAPAFTGRLA